VFANSEHGSIAALGSGAVQGCVSALLTLFLKRTVDWLRPRFRDPLAYFTPALIASIGSLLLLFTAHTIANTPEIAATIAVPLVVSASYIFSYNILTHSKGR